MVQFDQRTLLDACPRSLCRGAVGQCLSAHACLLNATLVEEAVSDV